MEIDLTTAKIGIFWSGPNGIGDCVVKSSIPENFYKNFNNKLIDVANNWVFDNNPYIRRDNKADYYIDIFADQVAIINRNMRISHKSNAAEFCWNYKIPKLFLRNPRLYIFENEPTVPNRITVHIKGTTQGQMPQHVMDYLHLNYPNYELIQIGMPNEPKVKGSIDRTGLSKWDTAKIIASSALYLGVDSGFYHVANCYPKVRKKIILNFKEEKLIKFTPLNLDLDPDFVWLDYNIEYYNVYDKDIGITNSYLKI